MSPAQVVAALRAQGQNQLADLVSTLNLTPGIGVNFGALGQLLLLLVGLYLLSSFFGWIQAYVMAGVTQRTVYRLRGDVDRKLARLPLSYFDNHPRGDLLSRVTNDIDNIGQSLQQSLTQLITSLLTIVGVLVIMLLIADAGRHLAPGRACLAGRDDVRRPPLAEAVHRAMGFNGRPQRPRRGDAHGPRDRQGIRTAEGSRGAVQRENERLYQASVGRSSSPG